MAERTRRAKKGAEPAVAEQPAAPQPAPAALPQLDIPELTSAQKSAVGDRVAYDINVTSGGKHISDMGG